MSEKLVINNQKKLNSHIGMLLTSIYENHRIMYRLDSESAITYFAHEIIEDLDELEESLEQWEIASQQVSTPGFKADCLKMNMTFTSTVSNYINAQKILNAIDKVVYN